MDHVDAHHLGRVLAAETGFKLAADPDTVRAPDVTFVRHDRVPDPPPAGYAELAPDLVVEILSPGDRPGEILAKVADWLNAGTSLAWVVDPERRLARVYRQDGTEGLVAATEALSGDALNTLASPRSHRAAVPWVRDRLYNPVSGAVRFA